VISVAESSGSKVEELKPGLTPVSLFAILYATVVMTPVIIFLRIMAGVADVIRFIPVFITLLLFTEVGRFTYRYVTSQEAFIIYFMAEMVAFDAPYFGGFIYTLYLRKAPYTKLFGLAEKIPTWAAPPLNSYGAVFRTFIAPEWATPIAVALIGFTAGMLIDFALSFILIQLFIEIEDLPYPVAPIDAQAITTLTERTPEKITWFSIAAVIGFIYEFILYGMPSITETFLKTKIHFIPYPWIDLTSLIEKVLPGAMFGIATDISMFVVGWVVPFDAAMWIFIGSLCTFVIGNFLALKIPHPAFAEWQREWTPGLSLSWLWQRSVYNIWASPLIGLTLGASLYVFVRSIKYMGKALDSLRKLTEVSRAKGYLSLKYVLLMWITGVILGIAIDCLLVPELWYVWSFIWAIVPFLQAILVGRMIAEIGIGTGIPYIREALLLATTSPGYVDPWMVPSKTTTAAGIIAHRIKVALLTKTKPIDYYKASVIAIPAIIFASFVFWSLFWSMAPIPSAMYPWTAISWPVQSLNFALWVSRSLQIFKPVQIVSAIVFIFVISAIAEKFKLPFSYLGFVAGAGMVPPFALNYFLGALVGRYIEKKVGKERWEVLRSVIIAGLFCGTGLAVGLAVAILLVGRSIWGAPY